MDVHFLTPLFTPKSIVVFAGPADDAERQTPYARALRAALAAAPGSAEPVYLDVQTTGTLADLARARADLAIIALPPDEVAAAMEVAARIGCRAVLIIGSGLDAERCAQLQRIARRENVHLLGPNSLGFQRPSLGLNASAAGPLPLEGSLALVSQSGALTASMLDWARHNHVGFSQVVSIGPDAAVDLAQVLDFLATDARTHGIVVYLEGIANARRFMSALRSAAHAKPVVVLKAGRRSAGNEAALTHCRAIVGSDDVFDAALRRAGAVRVRSFVELFSASKCLAARYRPVGKRLGIVTNGGGPGVLAADWVSEIGLQLGRLSAESVNALRPQLPPRTSMSDLIDLSSEAGPEHFAAALQAVARDPGMDGALVIFSPQLESDALETARAIAALQPAFGKPLLACWMGDATVAAARRLLNDAGIPSFRTPEAAVGAFGNLASFYENQQLLQQTPPPMSDLAVPDIEGARLLIESVLAERRRSLTELESKALLAAFHIPVTQTMLARNPNEAMMIATQLGFPVALKIDSPDVVHKSDVQGVVLNIQNGASARDAYAEMIERVRRLQPDARINGVTVQRMARNRRGREVYVGMVTDPAFGPVIVFGAGGTMIELIADRSMELPPLNQFLARRLIDRARIAESLAELPGMPAANLDALERVLLRVSEMVCEFPQLREMDINPLIVDEDGAVAVDARVVLHPIGQAARSGDYGHLAILPYPARYVQVWPLKGGGEVSVRPVRPDDAESLQQLVRGLKPESRYFRFVSSMTELPPALLSRLTLIDYDREMALVALYRERVAGPDGEMVDAERIVGVSRCITNPDQTSCEFSLLVADDFAGRGLGSRLMEAIMDAAREMGLDEIDGLVLTNNADMLKLMRALGFTIKPFAEDPDFRLVTRRLQG
ncbi:bifunctional acetate--CoA ligase family protein/GNAT family N-acetyltransferase [Roseateles paludis]|uniref:Bifunctional acetate--CoA ligase family protein/GNAT family N-acetyltransferase n=1 Tax=Roseateles paludis TaxID=3145238 RepID=A0ABV0FVJ9_9BURK